MFRIWWPLAASWLLMGLELPLVSAIIARLPDQKLNLAAYGGIVFPICLVIEGPIIMMLAASTALCKDMESYRRLHRFMMIVSGGLTAIHVGLACTPLYGWVMPALFNVDPKVLELARPGLILMLPWTWAIAYRRFQQGVLIRFGHTRAVSLGTLIRLSTNAGVLWLGATLETGSGVVVATTAVASAVMAEAIYAGLRVRPILRGPLRLSPAAEKPLTLSRLLAFYVPLALTPFFNLLTQPIGSIAMSNMPRSIASLALWPVVNGLVFLLRALGYACNEVVVAQLEHPGTWHALRRFITWLSLVASGLLIAIAATPLGELWFGGVSDLEPELVSFAKKAIWIPILMPALSAFQNWLQGILVHAHKTRAIPESIFLSLVTISIVLTAGVILDSVPGLYVTLSAVFLGSIVQTVWLTWRSRSVRAERRAQEPQE
ncbi:MAG: hypothetical protein RL885_05110 [Planctomycetota bacterium]